MTIDDLFTYMINNSNDIRIWNINSEEYVFEGSVEETKSSMYIDSEICTFEIQDDVVVINIEE